MKKIKQIKFTAWTINFISKFNHHEKLKNKKQERDYRWFRESELSREGKEAREEEEEEPRVGMVEKDKIVAIFFIICFWYLEE